MPQTVNVVPRQVIQEQRANTVSATLFISDPGDYDGGELVVSVRSDTQRSLPFDLDMAIIKLARDHPEHPSVVELTSVYLLRQWSEV